MPSLRLAGLGAWVLLASCSASFTATPASIVIDGSQEHQVVNGWEATAESGQDEPAAAAAVPAALDQANRLGITRLRLEVLSGEESSRDAWAERRAGRMNEAEYRCLRYATVNDNSDPDTIDPRGFQFARLDRTVETVVLPFKARVESEGRRFHLNVTYVAFTKQICGGGRYGHDDPREYAEFVVATLEHLRRKHALIADTWEVILEPDNTASWSGMQIGRAIVAASARVRASGLPTRFVAPSCTSMRRALTYFDEISRVPGAIDQLAEISYHRYAGVSDDTLRALASRAERFGLATAMLEKIGASYPELHADLKIGNASAWQQFTLAYPAKDNGAQYFTIDGSGVTAGDRTRYLAQYFSNVRPGARRIGASSDASQFDPLAFRNTDGRVAVLLKAAAEGAVVVTGLPGGEYEVTSVTSRSSDSRTERHSVAPDGALRARVAGAGVVSIVARRPA